MLPDIFKDLLYLFCLLCFRSSVSVCPSSSWAPCCLCCLMVWWTLSPTVPEHPAWSSTPCWRTEVLACRIWYITLSSESGKSNSFFSASKCYMIRIYWTWRFIDKQTDIINIRVIWFVVNWHFISIICFKKTIH